MHLFYAKAPIICPVALATKKLIHDRINPKQKIRPGKPLLHGPKSVLTHLPMSIKGSQVERMEVKLPKSSQRVLASKTAS